MPLRQWYFQTSKKRLRFCQYLFIWVEERENLVLFQDRGHKLSTFTLVSFLRKEDIGLQKPAKQFVLSTFLSNEFNSLEFGKSSAVSEHLHD